MRARKPHLKDNGPRQLCLLCNRYFCADHKGNKEGVCEINHETYYRNHPEMQRHLYATYEDFKRDYDEMMAAEASPPPASSWRNAEEEVVVVVATEKADCGPGQQGEK